MILDVVKLNMSNLTLEQCEDLKDRIYNAMIDFAHDNRIDTAGLLADVDIAVLDE